MVNTVATEDIDKRVVIDSAFRIGLPVMRPNDRFAFEMLNHLFEEMGGVRDITGLNDAVTTIDTREGINEGDFVMMHGAVHNNADVPTEIVGDDGRFGFLQELKMKVCYTVATVRTLKS